MSGPTDRDVAMHRAVAEMLERRLAPLRAEIDSLRARVAELEDELRAERPDPRTEARDGRP